MSRVVHYCSAGSQRLFFECYRADLRAYLDKTKPHPVSRTDVSKVTCPHCIHRLGMLVSAKAGEHGTRQKP